MLQTNNRKVREARKMAKKRGMRIRTISFFIITVMVLGIAGSLLVNAFTRPSLPVAENIIDVTADMAGFDQEEIRVQVDQPITVRLTSLDNSYHTDGGGKHQWAVDELDVNVIAPPKGTAMATFTPTTPGVYTFYCDVCCGGRANPTMNGKLVVEG